MDYMELCIPTVSGEQAEILMAWLADFPFDSFEQEEACLKAFIREDDLRTYRREIDELLEETGSDYRFTPIETVNWNEVWESNFAPVDVEGRCMIRAPFHPAAKGCQTEIDIMPKMSFGTGHHATTWLMVSEIMERDFSGMRGLDMGCGTGVLAIAAVICGAVSVDAVDVDEWAYENAAENIAVNGAADKITPLLGDVSLLGTDTYDFVLANINRNILLADMDRYVAAMKRSGLLIMSGILEKDVEDITSRAVELGLIPERRSVRDGWVAAVFNKI